MDDILAEKTIVTVTGKNALRKNCRLIQEEYYIIGNINIENSGECYKMENGRYFRFNTGKIVFDCKKSKYVIHAKNPQLVQGVVDIKDGAEVIGYFEPNVFDDLYVYTGRDYMPTIMTHSELKSKRYDRPKGDEYYCNTEAVFGGPVGSSKATVFGRNKGKSDYPYFNTNLYGASNNPQFDEVNTVFTNMFNSSLDVETPISQYEQLLDSYSYGIEWETIQGHIPVRDCFRSGLVPVKDGSVNGHEFISVPYFTNRLNAIEQACIHLSNNCAVDKFTSLHLHIGGAPKNKQFLISFYMLCCRLQQEIFEMLPSFKRSAKFFSQKNGKNHCQFLDSLGLGNNRVFALGEGLERTREIDRLYDRILLFLNEGNPVEQDDAGKPMHFASGRNKWDQHSRYFWVNLLPIIFGNSGTIEFRAHHGTVNKYKTAFWTFICTAIIKYAENNQQKIINGQDKILLTEVIIDSYADLGTAGSFLTETLLQYIRDRSDLFGNSFIKGVDSDGFEYKTKSSDPRFTYSYNGDIFKKTLLK